MKKKRIIPLVDCRYSLERIEGRRKTTFCLAFEVSTKKSPFVLFHKPTVSVFNFNFPLNFIETLASKDVE